MAKYLIFGGSGFIGRKIVSRLAKDETNEIIVADVMESPFLKKYHNVSFREFDFVGRESFAGELEGIDVVYHLISTITPNDDTEHIWEDLESNVRPTIALLEEMRKYPECKLVFMSSGGTVYGNKSCQPLDEEVALDPICNYGIGKVMIEKYILLYHTLHGLNYRIIRLSNPYGTKARKNQKQGLIPIVSEQIMRGETVTVFGDGCNVRDYIHIDDAVTGVLLIEKSEKNHGTYNIGFGEGHSILEIIRMIVEELGCEMPQIQFTPERKCDVKYNVLDISKVCSEFGWKPEISLKDGIHMMIENIREDER